jgi:hypothetical protein
MLSNNSLMFAPTRTTRTTPKKVVLFLFLSPPSDQQGGGSALFPSLFLRVESEDGCLVTADQQEGRHIGCQ